MQASAEAEASAPEWALLVEVPEPDHATCMHAKLRDSHLGGSVCRMMACWLMCTPTATVWPSIKPSHVSMHAGASVCSSGWPQLGLHKQVGNV